MQKADPTGSGSTTQMAQSGGESTGTTAGLTGSGRSTGLMAHWRGESTGTTGSERVLRRSGTLRAELPVRNTI